MKPKGEQVRAGQRVHRGSWEVPVRPCAWPPPGPLLSPPRLRENHAAGRHVREAAAHRDLAWGGVRERPGAAQGAVPGLLLLRPAGARILACPQELGGGGGGGGTLEDADRSLAAERHSAEQPHRPRDAELHGAPGHPPRFPELLPEEGGCLTVASYPLVPPFARSSPSVFTKSLELLCPLWLWGT